MFKLSICIFLFSFLYACHFSDPSFIRIKVDGGRAGLTPVLQLGESTYSFTLDSTGFAEINYPQLSVPAGGMLQYGRYRLLLYLEPEKNLDIYVNLFPDSFGAEFRGTGALKNEILNGKFRETDFMPDFTLEETAFIRSLETVKQNYDRKIDSLHLDSFFSGWIKEKSKYSIFKYLGEYPQKHADALHLNTYIPSEFYKEYLRNLMIQEKGGWEDKDYQQAMLSWVEVYSRKDLSENTAFGILLAELEFIGRGIPSSSLAEFLTDRYVTDYVTENGIDSLGRILPYYKAKVKSRKKRDDFEKLCERWQNKAPGSAAWNFKGINVDSIAVRLSDFEGKFVYLCFWNTTCYPSVKSLLSLKEMQRKWKNQDICFIGISTDKEEKTWKKFVTSKELPGIQLWGKDREEQIDFYHIRQLPYFVLINPQGKIVKTTGISPTDRDITDLLKQAEREKKFVKFG